MRIVLVHRSLLALWAVTLVGAGGCKEPEKVYAASMCADPCCGGSGQIDCAENPNVACVFDAGAVDADPCGEYAYGCADGGYYESLPPASCASGDGGVTFTSFSPDTGADATATAEGGAPSDGATVSM